MKKLLLFIAIIGLSISSYAQDATKLKLANNCDANFARQFSDEIAKSFRTKYVFFDELIYLGGTKSTLIYVPENATDEQKKSLKAHMLYSERMSNFESEGNLCVNFTINKIGENKDLEITGVKKYQFEFVNGKFLDLFNFWKQNVDPVANTELISSKGISAIRKNELGFWYNFAKRPNSDIWYIKNYTYRINE